MGGSGSQGFGFAGFWGTTLSQLFGNWFRYRTLNLKPQTAINRKLREVWAVGVACTEALGLRGEARGGGFWGLGFRLRI